MAFGRESALLLSPISIPATHLLCEAAASLYPYVGVCPILEKLPRLAFLALTEDSQA